MKSTAIFATLCLHSALAFSPIRVSTRVQVQLPTSTSTKTTHTTTQTHTALYSTAANANTNTNTNNTNDVVIIDREGDLCLTKTILTAGDPNIPLKLKFGQVATVSYNVYKPSSTFKDTFTISKSSSTKSSTQKMIVGDENFIAGFQLGLNSMHVGEKSIIHITAESSVQYGYGVDGIPPILGPNEALDIEIQVLDVEEQQGSFGLAGGSSGGGAVGVAGGDVSAVSGMTGSGELGALDPMKPRTPEAIAAAYAARQEQMMLEKQGIEQKDGLEGLIDKAKEFYFFGFFEGETGERAPWILRPSITFPIAFAFVGIGFYIVYAVGGISERGAQITDELDDIVLSWNVVRDALAVVAMSLVQK